MAKESGRQREIISTENEMGWLCERGVEGLGKKGRMRANARGQWTRVVQTTGPDEEKDKEKNIK